MLEKLSNYEKPREKNDNGFNIKGSGAGIILYAKSSLTPRRIIRFHPFFHKKTFYESNSKSIFKIKISESVIKFE